VQLIFSKVSSGTFNYTDLLWLLLLQKLTILFSISAIMTTSDLQFDVTNIDFGHCTIYEAITQSVQLTNNSMLPQEFGFVGLPEVAFTVFATDILDSHMTCGWQIP